MNFQRKINAIPEQERAYMIGTIENIGESWVFFDETSEGATELKDLGTELEVWKDHSWHKGILFDQTLIYIENDFHYLIDGNQIRVTKKLSYAFMGLIEELSDSSYLNFVKTLNSLSYSLYDCIYCNNYQSLLQKRESKEGMNVIIFDNEDQICVVQHYFCRKSDEVSDRFEFSQSNGKRVLATFI